MDFPIDFFFFSEKLQRVPLIHVYKTKGSKNLDSVLSLTFRGLVTKVCAFLSIVSFVPHETFPILALREDGTSPSREGLHLSEFLYKTVSLMIHVTEISSAKFTCNQ